MNAAEIEMAKKIAARFLECGFYDDLPEQSRKALAETWAIVAAAAVSK